MNATKEIFIVDARRTPIGRFGGGLGALSAADLTLHVAEVLVPAALRNEVGQVILGQVIQAGAGLNVARQIGLRLGLPHATTAYTVNMACASGLKAIGLGTDVIGAGETELVLAGGVESMSRAPYYSHDCRWGRKLGDSPLVDAITGDGLSDPVLGLGMGETAERIADAFKLSRAEQDQFAFTSQQRAGAAREALRREIIPVSTKAGTVEHDEHPRPDTTLEKLAKLKPVFRPQGTVTAGNASGINDGAALVLLSSAAAAKRLNLRPRARIVAHASMGCDPAMMGLGPIGAIRRLCEQTGWSLPEVDAIEINEAFAAQALACARELNLDPAKLNQRGGAIALGHPVGCSGARVLVTLLHLMEDRNLRRGIAALCVGGGMGIAMAIEREA